MAQRILEPGQIETLAQRSIPHIRLPVRAQLFARRAARLRELAPVAAIGDYLQFIAAIADAQHAALKGFAATMPDQLQLDSAAGNGMPPILGASGARPPEWRDVLDTICAEISGKDEFPPGVDAIVARIQHAPEQWIQAQADAMLAARHAVIDQAAAPMIMAALQVCWAALASGFVADNVTALDVAGVCPLCGSLPVASMICANSPYQGYRYLHCGLCATEWHMVRALCSHCGASGKSVGYHYLDSDSKDKSIGTQGADAVRAESCEQCRSYRKIVYQEKYPDVEPLADDLASLALDLLLCEHGYHRASGNPMLWQPDES
ncbi:MAG: formate dehydrogenase accessory protein FdhE [Rudaea sp.]|nr:formate dehydrogenase accessory protein FdhE [Rudaea sp.]